MFTDDSFNGKGFSAEDKPDYCVCAADPNYDDTDYSDHMGYFKCFRCGYEGEGCDECGEGVEGTLGCTCPNNPALKVKLNAESHAYSYAYNEGHSDSRKDDGYNPIKSKQDLVPFKRVLKQKAESFNAEYPKGEKGYVIYSLGYNEGEQGKGRKSPESFVSMIAKFNDIENSYMLSDDDNAYTIYTIGYFDGESDKINKRTPQAFELMLSKMGKSYGKPLLSSIPKTARLDAESKMNCGCGQDPCKTYGAETSYCHNHKTCGGYRVQGTFLCWPCHDIEADIRIAKRNDAESKKNCGCGQDPCKTYGAEDMDGSVVNIVGVEDKVYVTIRFPDTNEHYGYDKIFVGEMEDVMLAESFSADEFGPTEGYNELMERMERQIIADNPSCPQCKGPTKEHTRYKDGNIKNGLESYFICYNCIDYDTGEMPFEIKAAESFAADEGYNLKGVIPGIGKVKFIGVPTPEPKYDEEGRKIKKCMNCLMRGPGRRNPLRPKTKESIRKDIEKGYYEEGDWAEVTYWCPGSAIMFPREGEGERTTPHEWSDWETTPQYDNRMKEKYGEWGAEGSQGKTYFITDMRWEVDDDPSNPRMGYVDNLDHWGGTTENEIFQIIAESVEATLPFRGNFVTDITYEIKPYGYEDADYEQWKKENPNWDEDNLEYGAESFAAGHENCGMGPTYCIECGEDACFDCDTYCDNCEQTIHHKCIEQHGTDCLEAETFEATKGIDTFTEPFEEMGVPKWLIGIGGVVAAITGINYLSKKL